MPQKMAVFSSYVNHGQNEKGMASNISNLAIQCLSMYSLVSTSDKFLLLSLLFVDKISFDNDYYTLKLIDSIHYALNSPMIDKNFTIAVLDYLIVLICTPKNRTLFDTIFKKVRKQFCFKLHEIVIVSSHCHEIIGRVIQIYSILVSKGMLFFNYYYDHLNSVKYIEFLNEVSSTIQNSCNIKLIKTKSDFNQMQLERRIYIHYVGLMRHSLECIDKIKDYEKIFVKVSELLSPKTNSLIENLLLKEYNLSSFVNNIKNDLQYILSYCLDNTSEDCLDSLKLHLNNYGDYYRIDKSWMLALDSKCANVESIKSLNRLLGQIELDTRVVNELSLLLDVVCSKCTSIEFSKGISKKMELYCSRIMLLLSKKQLETHLCMQSIYFNKLSILNRCLSLFLNSGAMYTNMGELQQMANKHEQLNSNILELICSGKALILYCSPLIKLLVCINIRLFQCFKNASVIPPKEIPNFVSTLIFTLSHKYDDNSNIIELVSGMLLYCESYTNLSTCEYWLQDQCFLLRKLLALNGNEYQAFVFKKLIYLSNHIGSSLIDANIFSWINNHRALSEKGFEYYTNKKSRNPLLFHRTLAIYFLYTLLISGNDKSGRLQEIAQVHEHISGSMQKAFLCVKEKCLSIAYLEEVKVMLLYLNIYYRESAKRNFAHSLEKCGEFLLGALQFGHELFTIDSQKYQPLSQFENKLNLNELDTKQKKKTFYNLAVDINLCDISYALSLFIETQFTITKKYLSQSQFNTAKLQWISSAFKCVVTMLKYTCTAFEAWGINYKQITNSLSAFEQINKENNDSNAFPLFYNPKISTTGDRYMQSINSLMRSHEQLKKFNNDLKGGSQESSSSILSQEREIKRLIDKEAKAYQLILKEEGKSDKLSSSSFFPLKIVESYKQ